MFLDEIGDMPLALQAKILRLLQEQSFERIGGNETIQTDVRLIAATHRDLPAWSAEGKFRADLYYRLGVFPIDLPPLRERGDDLPLLVRYYLKRFSRELGREIHDITPESLDRLRSYTWPGNIRELQSVLKQALLQSFGTTLLPAFLPTLAGETTTPTTASTAAGGDPDLEAFIHKCLASEDSDLYAETHRKVDLLLLTRLLAEKGVTQRQAAHRLGIARETLRRRFRELGLHISRRLETEDDLID